MNAPAVDLEVEKMMSIINTSYPSLLKDYSCYSLQRLLLNWGGVWEGGDGGSRPYSVVVFPFFLYWTGFGCLLVLCHPFAASS